MSGCPGVKPRQHGKAVGNGDEINPFRKLTLPLSLGHNDVIRHIPARDLTCVKASRGLRVRRWGFMLATGRKQGMSFKMGTNYHLRGTPEIEKPHV
jgi:hypothetical protein